MFISRVELLPEDETTAEHNEAKRIEAQLIETDRTARIHGESGLFKGVFGSAQVQFRVPIRDDEDGVLRCPICAWEMEDGECGHCGYADFEQEFSGEEDFDANTVDSRSVASIHSSTMDGEDGEDVDVEEIMHPFIQNQSPEMQDDFRQWVIRDQAERRARRAARESSRLLHGHRSLMDHGHPVHPDHVMDGDQYDEEMGTYEEQHPYDYHPWHNDNGENVEEDEDMTSAIDEEDGESTTSFHRAAMIARDHGMNPPFESDLSTNASEGEGEGDGQTVTNGSNSSDSSESNDDSDTPESTPAVPRPVNRPARIVIDSDDDSSDDSSKDSSEDEVGEEQQQADQDNSADDSSDDSNDSETTPPPPPRPAAARQARVQMHRGRRGDRGGGRGRGRGRPRSRG